MGCIPDIFRRIETSRKNIDWPIILGLFGYVDICIMPVE